MTGLNVVRPRAHGYSRSRFKKIVRKKPRRKRFRGVPPPLVFDLDALPDSGHVSKPEVAAAARKSLSAVDYWLAHPDNLPLEWVFVGGRWLCVVRSLRVLLKGTKKKGAK